MANTYTSLFYHVIFVVKYREAMITDVVKEDLYRYITGIIDKQGHRLICINGVPDHVHILFRCNPHINLSDLMKEVKEHSTKFLNETGKLKHKFRWQSGFAAFTVCKRHTDVIKNYILNQEEHHRQKDLKKEYLNFLVENGIEYDRRYLFNFELE